MKTLVRTFFFVSFLMITVNCGTSVKVTDAWQVDDIDEAREEQYLVVARDSRQIKSRRYQSS